MSDPSSTPALPPWVKKRDGRVVPFDPDAIGQDLYAAAESVGHADPFLARELTDGVLHFLAADSPQTIPSTEWIGELVAKVVRELRQPKLAQAFSERRRPRAAVEQAEPRRQQTPESVARRHVAEYTLETVFSRDLAAAHREGLIVLSGLESPQELAAAVLTPPESAAALPALQLLDTVLEARSGIAGWISFDAPEFLELEKGSPPLPRLLTPVLQASGLTARLHLNTAEPPSWAAHTAQGPLFGEPEAKSPLESLHAAAVIVQAVLALPRERCPFAIDWHLSETDFAVAATSPRSELLESMVRAALGDYPITFVFDRPKRPISLGPGLDRLHGYLLMQVGLDLARLLDHTGITDDSELYLQKLASLARLAISAAVQKRQYLRESLREEPVARPFLQRGFLLDRARLIVTPLGLDRTIRTLTGTGYDERKSSLDLGRRALQTLSDVLGEEGQRRLIDTELETMEQVTSNGGHASARQQLTAAGKLHAISGSGTTVVALEEEERLGVDQVLRLLEFTWRQTEIARLQLQARPTPPDEPTLLG